MPGAWPGLAWPWPGQLGRPGLKVTHKTQASFHSIFLLSFNTSLFLFSTFPFKNLTWAGCRAFIMNSSPPSVTASVLQGLAFPLLTCVAIAVEFLSTMHFARITSPTMQLYLWVSFVGIVIGTFIIAFLTQPATASWFYRHRWSGCVHFLRSNSVSAPRWFKEPALD